MSRNKNLEAIRAAAVFGIVFYHYTVVLGIAEGEKARIAVEILAQIAMCSFYVLSGFGTFLYFQKHEGEKLWLPFLKKRFKGIAPSYYFCIFAILLTTGTVYFSPEIWKTIPIYLTFTQNLFPKYMGNLNGSSWTIALMMQFYLIAPVLYRFIGKKGILAYGFVLVLSVASRYCLDKQIQNAGLEDVYYVMANIRQLITTLDIFAAGMLAAKYKDRIGKSKIANNKLLVSFLLISIPILIVLFIYWSMLSGGLWIPTHWKCYIWESVIGLLLATFSAFFFWMPFDYSSPFGKLIQSIARSEMNTYLWHMILYSNLLNSFFFQQLLAWNPYVLCGAMLILAFTVGKVMSKIVGKEKRVSHCETAPVAALSALMYATGNME